jgi:ABC-type transport system involved in cytochrome c biogenesis permease subunit
MTIGMFFTLFIYRSRFRSLLRKTSEVRVARKNLSSFLIGLILTAGLSIESSAQHLDEGGIPEIDAAHAEAFGQLQVLDRAGRLKPVNSLASQLLRKIARRTHFEGMSPEQVFLGIIAFPHVWNEVPIIKITHPQLKEYLGVEGKYAAFNQFLDLNANGEYKLRQYVEHAYAKKPSAQNKFDKDVTQVDERVNIYYMLYTGSFLSIFPVKGDTDNKWSTPGQSTDLLNVQDSISVRAAFSAYINEVISASSSGDWTAANEKLEAISQYQAEYGKQILLSDTKVGVEIFYNKFQVFRKLAMYYFYIGFILLILHFINILKPRINLRWVIRIGSVLVFLLFLLHTGGLIMRWYISGHAPWSDGYESMIYIAWATILSGLIFVWRSGITLSVTAVLASLVLSVAGMNWMDPEITNLVPVLKSYWLIIHVAIITASYGFLALGALLGFLNMIFMIMKTKNNFERMNLSIKELKYIIEVNLIIGLFLLTIGTFLGGVWANESWGRYWGIRSGSIICLLYNCNYSYCKHLCVCKRPQVS